MIFEIAFDHRVRQDILWLVDPHISNFWTGSYITHDNVRDLARRFYRRGPQAR